MGHPQHVLGAEEYTNYRNVRAVSVLFVLLGSILMLGGIGLATNKEPSPQQKVPLAGAIGIAVAGMAGAIGGFAALRGNRRWAYLAYGMAALYILAFPIGTVLSWAMFKGLPRYLESVERLRNTPQ